MTKGFLRNCLTILTEYWNLALRDHRILLGYESIDSTDYMKDEVFAEAKLQYSLMEDQLTDRLEELDDSSAESSAVATVTQVRSQSNRHQTDI